MKTVFSNYQCIHVWAQRAQRHGKGGGSVRFEGNVLYSYAEPIARFIDVDKRKKKTCVFLTSNHFSQTTSGHARQAEHAVRGHVLPVFRVPYLYEHHRVDKQLHNENLKYFAREILNLSIAAKRARSNKQWKLDSLFAFVEKANEYSKFFGLRKKFKIPSDLDVEKELAKAKEIDRQEAILYAKRREENERRQKEQEERDKIIAAQWLNGCDVGFPYSQRIDGDRLRRIQGNMLQTSQGAEVPIAHALRVLPLIRSGKAYQHNGHSIHVGHFRIDSISEGGKVIRAGCHTFQREEIERIAALLGK